MERNIKNIHLEDINNDECEDRNVTEVRFYKNDKTAGSETVAAVLFVDITGFNVIKKQLIEIDSQGKLSIKEFKYTIFDSLDDLDDHLIYYASIGDKPVSYFIDYYDDHRELIYDNGKHDRVDDSWVAPDELPLNIDEYSRIEYIYGDLGETICGTMLYLDIIGIAGKYANINEGLDSDAVFKHYNYAYWLRADDILVVDAPITEYDLLKYSYDDELYVQPIKLSTGEMKYIISKIDMSYVIEHFTDAIYQCITSVGDYNEFVFDRWKNTTLDEYMDE